MQKKQKKYVPAIDTYFSSLLDKSPEFTPQERRKLSCHLYDSLQTLISLVEDLYQIYNYPKLEELYSKVKQKDLSPKLVASPYFVKEVREFLLTHDVEEEFKKKGLALVEEILSTAELLIKHNLRLVRNVLTSMLYTSPERADEKVLSEGVWAAIHAIYSYNPYKGTELSTYIAWWVKSIVGEVLDKRKFSSSAPEPQWVRKPASAFGKIPYRRVMVLKRNPTLKELEEITGVNIASFFSSMLEKSEKIYLYDKNVIEEDVEHTISDDFNLEFEYLSQDLKEKLFICMAELTKEEQEIVSLHFGFKGKPMSLRQIARKMKKSQEAIRRKFITAMEKLKRCLNEPRSEE